MSPASGIGPTCAFTDDDFSCTDEAVPDSDYCSHHGFIMEEPEFWGVGQPKPTFAEVEAAMIGEFMPCLGCDDCPDCNERHRIEQEDDESVPGIGLVLVEGKFRSAHPLETPVTDQRGITWTHAYIKDETGEVVLYNLTDREDVTEDPLTDQKDVTEDPLFCPVCGCPYLPSYGCETGGCPGPTQKDDSEVA